jgi:Arc/MetJ-type ribon-helix-helix transcriptional regulator
MITIPVGLDEETLEKLDTLVKKGLYKNRTEAIRAQIINGLDKRSIIELKETPEGIKEKIFQKLLQSSKPINILPTKKSITELVSEGRER